MNLNTFEKREILEMAIRAYNEKFGESYELQSKEGELPNHFGIVNLFIRSEATGKTIYYDNQEFSKLEKQINVYNPYDALIDRAFHGFLLSGISSFHSLPYKFKCLGNANCKEQCKYCKLQEDEK